MQATTLALVGATGGAGTTRTAVELAALGARDGRDVAVVDAAFTTQGLSEYVSGRIDADVTALVTDEAGASLSAAAYPIDTESSDRDGDRALPGRADLLPARAPFERAARAKTAEAARKLERRIGEATTAYDAVVVDTAPVGSNEAVAAVTAADRVEAVTPATAHGRDALQRLRGRVADVGGSVDGTIAVARAGESGSGRDDESAGGADTRLPPVDPAVESAPEAATGTGEYVEALAETYERAFDAALGADDSVAERYVVAEIGETALYHVRTRSFPPEQPLVFPLFRELDVTTIKASRDADGLHLRARCPGRDSLSAFRRSARDICDYVDVERLYVERGLETGRQTLTDRQREALALAHEHGYFETPSRTTLEDLSEDFALQTHSRRRRETRRRRHHRRYLKTLLHKHPRRSNPSY